MTHVARCFHCEWGLTHSVDVVAEQSLQHVSECPGPVVALNPTTDDGQLTFRSGLRCEGCGLPKTVCLCQRIDD